jgi:membrane-bound lytic murein transglycosylase D
MIRHLEVIIILVLTLFTQSYHAQVDILSMDSIAVNDTLVVEAEYEGFVDGFNLIARYDSIITLDFLFDEDLLALEIESSDPIVVIPDSIIKVQMQALNDRTPMDFIFTKDVGNFINLYAQRKRSLTEKAMGLGDLYFPIFEEMLDRYEIPLELKYLPIVESGMNPNARSRVGATGLWQFMYLTGKSYGLYVDSYIDERRDPYLETEAACRYLKFLYTIYDDWSLALAAYNAGPGNVNKAIRRSGGKRTYWEVRPYLPRETRSYVPAFIAVNYVMAYPEDYDLVKKPVKIEYTYTDTIHVNQRVVYEYLEAYTGVDKSMLSFLNPMYRRQLVPANAENTYAIVLPKERIPVFIINSDSIFTKSAVVNPELEAPTEKNQEVVYYKVRSGDVLGKIAQRYGVSVRDIQEWNNLRGTRINVGQRLTIYTSRP